MEIRESPRQPAEQVRDLMVETALRAYEDAGYGGLCVEGRWEAAVRAMQAVDVSSWAPHARDESTEASASTLDEFAAAVAKASPSPGGGSVAAVAGMLAASLVQMAAKLSPEGTAHLEPAEKKRVSERAAVAASELATLASRDAEATKLLASAHKAWSGTDALEELRVVSLERALLYATEVPFDIALLCAEVAELAALVARRGSARALCEAGVAALLAEAACKGASFAVRVNAASRQGGTEIKTWARFSQESALLVARATQAASSAEQMLEKTCGP